MRRYFLCASMAVVCGFASLAVGQPPAGGPGGGRGPGGPGGPGGRPAPGQILPPGMREMLKLTDEQVKELDVLQKDVDAKLAKVLTADQLKQLKDVRGGGFGGRGGPGGPGGERGGPGGERGPRGERPDGDRNK